jgi:type II secretory pathway component PulF
MYLLLTTVIPKLSDILLEAGQEIPFYTKVVIAISSFLTSYGPFMIIGLAISLIGVWRYRQSEEGKITLDRLKLSLPYLGKLYKTLYLSRIADNMDTMLTSSIPMVRALEITAAIVGNSIYRTILTEVAEAVRTGTTVSDALSKYPDIPGIMVAMTRVGEETGELGEILKTLAAFYRREVYNAVEALVSLIQPALIIFLAGGVGVVLASVLIPIYNIAGGI